MACSQKETSPVTSRQKSVSAAGSVPSVSTTVFAQPATVKEYEAPAQISRGDQVALNCAWVEFGSLTSTADAIRGGNDLIPCENVTSNPLDFCCDGVALCCDGGGGRFRLDSVGEPFRTLSSAAITATRLPSTSTSSRGTISTSTSSASPIPTSSPVSPPAVRPPLTPEPPADLAQRGVPQCYYPNGGLAQDANTGGTDLIPCENVTSNPLDFCCDHTAFCCDSGAGRFRFDSGEPTRTISSAASTATRSPATTSLPPISTPTPRPISNVSSPSAGLSTGAKAAIGVGAALGIVLIILAVIFWLWRRRKRSSVQSAQSLARVDSQNIDNQNGKHQQPATMEDNSYYGSGLYEMPGEQHRELAGRPHYEMPAANHHPAWEMPVETRTSSLR
ncbi:MAG: hypothetical protein LQ337_008879 [Flavoplaca oasis]|nr:MAG: hypothetical protein LQ337_008879 [Flavoplaca oasis]